MTTLEEKVIDYINMADKYIDSLNERNDLAKRLRLIDAIITLDKLNYETAKNELKSAMDISELDFKEFDYNIEDY